MKIAFFDSGIGGITVLKEALGLLPCEDYIYYSDTRNVPYGTKSKEEVTDLVGAAAAFLAGLGIKALVLACNTATSVAVNGLRARYSFPVIGMEPAVKPGVERSQGRRVLVLATSLTLKEEKLNNLISKLDKNRLVDKMPLDGLVPLAERFLFCGGEVDEFIRRSFAGLELSDYGTVVLGCTHFVFYRKRFSEALPAGVEIIDGNRGTVRQLARVLEEKKLLNGPSGGGKRPEVAFYSSGAPETGERAGKLSALLGE